MTVATRPLSGTIHVPGDKSISHRALILGALAHGETTISGLSTGKDVTSTIRCLQQLGIDATAERVYGGSFHPPKEPLDCGNSGTTMRLLMGLLSSQPFKSVLTGDASLLKRPMGRVADPLRRMGACIEGEYAPVIVQGNPLSGIDHHLCIASAQLKSALLLAAVQAKGKTRLTGMIHSRNHTEEMLVDFGVSIKVETDCIEIEGGQRLTPCHISIPGDPSSAAFFAAAAALVPGSCITLRNVCTNATRTHFFEVLKRMGGSVILDNDITIEFAPLNGVVIEEKEIPFLIDELPLIGILGSQAKGVTVVKGATELRVKESDRIEALCNNLEKMGVKIEQFDDGFSVEGPQKMRGALLDSYYDHRIAMAFAVAALAAEGETYILNSEAAAISYPEFYKDLGKLHG